MAKKRKASRQPSGPTGPKDYDPADARLGPMTDYTDLADEQEQHLLDKDRILFEDEPGTKRQKRLDKEEAFLELSDDEVLGDDPDSSDDELQQIGRKFKKGRQEDEDEDGSEADDGDQEGDSGWWGDSRKEYYENEVIETEDNAREEEEEALRLQKKQLARMTASDFFDADEWAAEDEADKAADGGARGGDTVTVTMKTAEEIDAMTPEEQLQLLQTQYPELDYMCDEFAALEPLLNEYRKTAEGKPSGSLEVIQYRVLSCYLSTMALYFSLLMAPTRDNPGGARRLMDPQELHDHEVMAYLVDSRQTWDWVKRVQARRVKAAKAAKAAKALGLEELVLPEEESSVVKTEKKPKKAKAKKAEEKKTKSKGLGAVSKEVEESIADLSKLLTRKKKKPAAPTAATAAAAAAADDSDGQSDLGEEETLDARTAEEKAKRKKSLGFYTSQIMQTANRRADAGGQTGGDLDIPYRERLKDRAARLTAAAERRGQGADLDEEEEDDEEGEEAGGDDEYDENLKYYNTIVRAHKQKMDSKALRKAEIAAGKLERVEPAQWADEDGRRQLTWQIQKNKGLNHRSIKEKKNNPRVKKRKKFEKKTKQLASMRAVYKGGDRTNYQGEKTGIKTGLVRSVKLS